MNATERFQMRQVMVAALRENVEAQGGDLSDGFIILIIATMEIYAAQAVVSGKDAATAKVELIELISKFFDEAYSQSARAVVRESVVI